MNHPSHANQTLLVVDDDTNFCDALARAMQRRNYQVVTAHDKTKALLAANQFKPGYAVVDLRLGQTSGLTLIQQLLQEHTRMRIIVLTGYASIATAVEAIKLGAAHYLTKPADPNDIMRALDDQESGGDSHVELADRPMSVRRLEWEHIQRVLQNHNGNISAAARTLKMHRRSLQRKLLKRPCAD
jgi:two-component system response regulator RegA